MLLFNKIIPNVLHNIVAILSPPPAPFFPTSRSTRARHVHGHTHLHIDSHSPKPNDPTMHSQTHSHSLSHSHSHSHSHTHSHSRRSNNRSFLLPTLLCLLPLPFLLFITHHTPPPTFSTRSVFLRTNPSSSFSFPPIRPNSLPTFPASGVAAHCLNVIASSSFDWHPFNSRTFCLHSSPMCVSSRTNSTPGVLHLSPPDFPAPSEVTTCSAVAANLHVKFPHIRPPRDDCSNVACAVHCAHGGHQHSDSFPTCADIQLFHSGLLNDNHSTYVVPKNTTLVVVPAFSFTDNIFHYLQLMVQTINAVSIVPVSSKLHIILRGNNPKDQGLWQSGLIQLLFEYSRGVRIEDNDSISVESLLEDDVAKSHVGEMPYPAVRTSRKTVCTTGNTVLLGHRTSSVMWPFPGGSQSQIWPFRSTQKAVRVITHTVPALALHFRAAVHHAINAHNGTMYSFLSHSFPAGHTSSFANRHPSENPILLDLPARRVLYAKRSRAKFFERVPGYGRILSDNDEAWLLETFRTLTKHYANNKKNNNTKWEVVQFIAGNEMQYTEQAGPFTSAGIVVGLHGANLVNIVNQHTFSSVLELSNVQMVCYVNGMNAGLQYWNYKVGREDEQLDNWSPVSLQSWNDRINIKEIIMQMVIYTETLHREFGELGGIPVRYVEKNDEYRIVWDMGKSGGKGMGIEKEGECLEGGGEDDLMASLLSEGSCAWGAENKSRRRRRIRTPFSWLPF